VAVIADGDKLRRDLPEPQATGCSSRLIEIVLAIFELELPAANLARIALTLGSLGHFCASMVGPLQAIVQDPKAHQRPQR